MNSSSQSPKSPLRKKLKWVGRYISLPLALVLLFFYIISITSPDSLEAIGIDVQKLMKYGTWFFIIKGSISTLLIIYGVVYLRNRNKK